MSIEDDFQVEAMDDLLAEHDRLEEECKQLRAERDRLAERCLELEYEIRIRDERIVKAERKLTDRAQCCTENEEQVERLKNELYDAFALKPGAHEDPSDCPTWYDSCHCTSATLADQVKRAETAEERLKALRAKGCRSRRSPMGSDLFAFECRTKDADWATIVNAPTAGKARYQYWLMASDAWPNLKLTEISVRKAGTPVSSDMLHHVNEIRSRQYRAGDHVTLSDGRKATIAGAGGGGAYYEVWIGPDEHGYVHPCDIREEVSDGK